MVTLTSNYLAVSWLDMREYEPANFQAAIVFDEANRHNPLVGRGSSTSDELSIYRHGGALGLADLEADAARERKAVQPPLCNGFCFT